MPPLSLLNVINHLIRAAVCVTVGAACVLALAVPAPAAQSLPLDQAIAALPQAAESHTGYDPTKFPHWNAGADPGDGCDTRGEVLVAEAVSAPTVEPGCRLVGGTWWSYYDAGEITSAAALDVTHTVALAEAWESGASQWTAERRESYANDLGDPRTLNAVSAASHRSKGDQDPAHWLPSNTRATCRYITEWTAVKLRWRLTADRDERQSLAQLAESCPNTTVTFTPAP
ncbi:HNH endonuclease family protein [Streptomyces sp. NRRL B-24085]|uniref:HNH endonuclease family protein n=1 Tax=Streptomyces sp. NRRL B-24085 TaxID=1709476 RepID=UPI000A5EB703|nr:HNH endonuclease family protein [Streptomyces sp. NRRL B-24085]